MRRVAALERQMPAVEPPLDQEAMRARIYEKLFAPVPDGPVEPVTLRPSDDPSVLRLREKLLGHDWATAGSTKTR